jgi:hypothetical protein
MWSVWFQVGILKLLSKSFVSLRVYVKLFSWQKVLFLKETEV